MHNLTKRARHIIEYLSNSEGKRLGSDSLGPEHILLAILKDHNCTAIKILTGLGVSIDAFQKNIEKSIPRKGSLFTLGSLPMNSRFNHILDFAKEESKKLNSPFTGTEHLLMALVKDASLSPVESLIQAGIDYVTVYEYYKKMQEAQESDDEYSKNQKMKTNFLDEFTVDLTMLARQGKLDAVIGREIEINRIIHILCRKTKNNPVIVGEAGVGKTAIAEGLAVRIVKSETPAFLHNKKILSLDIASVVAGTKFRGDFEDRMKRIIREIKADTNVILFIDEMHTIMGAGAAEGAIDAANILKPSLARGEVQCIGATTIKEYKKHIEKDPALERRFQKVIINETSIPQTIHILKGIVSKYEDHHHVKYDDEAIIAAVTLSKRYINDRNLPDKAIDCIDEAGARKRIEGEKTPAEVDRLQFEVASLQIEKNDHVNNQRFENAAMVRDQINRKKDEIESIIKTWRAHEEPFSLTVDRNTILSVIQDWTGIQIADSRIDDERFLSMESNLQTKIIGQDHAIETVSRAFRRNRAGIRKGVRPISSFFFVGPTGVGKTELAKIIAEFLFNDKNNLIRIDMSEYMEKHAVARLIGSPPGYVGYDDGGQLTEKVRNKPYSVILFDEIEKSHPDFANILLQILEEGELTDGSGSRISFKDTVIIMTSNIGNTRFDKTGSIGFDGNSDTLRHSIIDSEIKKTFNPELINRIDEIVVFNSLSDADIRQIIILHLEDLSSRLSEKNIKFKYTEDVIDYIARIAYSAEWGARQVRRTIEREIEDGVASFLLSGEMLDNSSIIVRISSDRLHFFKEDNSSEPIHHETVDVIHG